MPAIRIQDVGKRYRLGITHAGSVRELANRLAGRLVGRRQPAPAPAHSQGQPAGNTERHFWALRHVSFDVQPGEVVGIIGKNGAGKSTLLKLLSRISKPTEGRIELRGRVASLLEVGTGFHPELTGRENVFLNGTILGMTRREVGRRYDEIVEFSGVDRFIDTPVKRYSSGMKVRLAFAVAAHLDPEILIVDEVLAVGDAEFQRRCLGKMNEVAHAGKTVLFVSHNMSAVRSLTTTGALLAGGRLVARGPILEVIAEYLQDDDSVLRSEIEYESGEAASGAASLRAIRLLARDGRQRSEFSSDEPIQIEIDLESAAIPYIQTGIEVQNQHATPVFRTFSNDVFDLTQALRTTAGKYTARCEIPACLLNEGQYRIRPILKTATDSPIVMPDRAPLLQIEFDVPNKALIIRGRVGVVAPIIPWELQPSTHTTVAAATAAVPPAFVAGGPTSEL
ncbi:MAG: ABC transporter ATP-binding protein [Planctomycetaceae bacterium]|nr:ABC transporter ATP-binding protein [Planctomycetaceae bacterium]